jgi:hypothetical protein
METVVRLLSQDGSVNFSIVQIICLFIDGLAMPRKGKVQQDFCAYIDLHFPELCAAIGNSETFYTHFRSKAIHEFNTLPPFALETTKAPSAPYIREDHGYKIFNVDRFISDFRRHLGDLIV